MDLLTIIAIDKDSSDTKSRTFSTDSVELFEKAIEEFEEELSFRKYELICDEFMDEYPAEIVKVLDKLEVTY